MEQNIESPAGFWVRVIANLVDSIIVSVPFSVISVLINSTATISTSDVWNIITVILELLYGIVVPIIWSGYTIGKKLLGIRIAKVNGEKIGLGTMLLRQFLGGLIYVVTLGIGLIVSAFMVGLRQDKRAIHDLIAGTYVTYSKP